MRWCLVCSFIDHYVVDIVDAADAQCRVEGTANPSL